MTWYLKPTTARPSSPVCGPPGKIGYLLTQIRIRGEDSEWVQAIVELSLKYGIITLYTSFLIEEPAEALSGRAGSGK